MSHEYEDAERNSDIWINLRRHPVKATDPPGVAFVLVRRPDATVSVFDSGFLLGDGVWEGIRLHAGVLLSAKQHVDRLFEGATALAMDLGCSKQQMVDEIYKACDANEMNSDVHVRLVVSRGLKPTPYQNPKTTIGLPTVAIIPEWKAVKDDADSARVRGITLFTTHVRRGPSDVQDPMWNSLSKLNCIAACIQATAAGADEALMLDVHGFVATCNSTNFFVVRDGAVWTPTTKYQLHGITRTAVLALCSKNGIAVKECDFSLTQVYSADEAFVTGTFAGQIPVVTVDGRTIGDGKRGPVTERLQQLYKAYVVEATRDRAIAWKK
ncbi:branched chain amino acid aminotransferase [Pelagophyceae sp. CCMP2097]|nr:branched chain amino acid aminotransferase [Pelagophyceae sp. CCMP2097]|mmetsp:Transcript_6772/g.21853  ORF Transcript_6772/g.21853 Transcript_6772/m.21853 type:complete len:325 (-) Transcript_6772:32-1006(-)